MRLLFKGSKLTLGAAFLAECFSLPVVKSHIFAHRHGVL